jgi:squalene-hopene/tetraprenyl-beta-curcumene cyclase
MELIVKTMQKVVPNSTCRGSARRGPIAPHSPPLELRSYISTGLIALCLGHPSVAQTTSRRAIQARTHQNGAAAAAFSAAIMALGTGSTDTDKSGHAYQYHHGNIAISSASAEEPKLQRFSQKLAMDYIERGAQAWTEQYNCVSCHTNGSYMLVRPLLLPQLGPPQKEIRDFFVSTLHQQLATDTAALRSDLGPAQVVYVAAGLAAWDAHVLKSLSPDTDQALGLMFKLQRDSGTWASNDCWPPFESSAFQLATVAAIAAGTAPGWLVKHNAGPLKPSIDRLIKFLRERPPLQGDYDRTALLWAASEFPHLLDWERKQDLIEMVWKHQRPDGGWSIRSFALPEQWGKGNRAVKPRSEPDFSGPPSDGHMTGLAIVTLRKAGVPSDDLRIRRGVSWLLHNQRSSGRWWTRSLNTDEWHFVTYSGTLYPLLALALCDAFPPLPESLH